jgi:hypothetical protein
MKNTMETYVTGKQIEKIKYFSSVYFSQKKGKERHMKSVSLTLPKALQN